MQVFEAPRAAKVETSDAMPRGQKHGASLVVPECLAKSLLELGPAMTRYSDPFNLGCDFSFSNEVEIHSPAGVKIASTRNGALLAALAETELEVQRSELRGNIGYHRSQSSRVALGQVVQTSVQCEDLMSAVAMRMVVPIDRAGIFNQVLPEFRRISLSAALHLLYQDTHDELAETAAQVIAKALLRGSNVVDSKAIAVFQKQVANFAGLFENVFASDLERAAATEECINFALEARRQVLISNGKTVAEICYETARAWRSCCAF